jgi:hypothetical protein
MYAAKQHVLTYYMQRDGIVKPVERLIQAQAMRLRGGKARKNAAIWGAVPGNDGLDYSRTRSSFCKQRVARTTAGISSSGKLVFQLVTPTSPT